MRRFAPAERSEAIGSHDTLIIIKISDVTSFVSSDIVPVLPPYSYFSFYSFQILVIYIRFMTFSRHEDIIQIIVSFCRKNKKNLYSRIRR
jgi:hypothetical protein